MGDDYYEDHCYECTGYGDDYYFDEESRMSDLISRKALCEYALNQKDKSVTPNDIMRFPSAQPEKRTEKRTETHACDLISRQVAIDALDHMDYMPGEWAVKGLTMCKEIIKGLPSAQPEIVRCKDCMYWVAHDKRCVYLNHGFAPNMWCCHGRRTDE